MPSPVGGDTTSLVPTGHKYQATSNTAVAVPIPNGTRAIEVRPDSASHYLGVGTSPVAPALGESNAVSISSGTTAFYPSRNVHTHLYVATSAGGATDGVAVNFYR